MADEFRFDAVGKLGKAKRTPQGGARVPASLTRTGLLKYRRADGTERVEFRPAEEVFRADSLEQIQGAPVTVGHVAMITPANYKAHAVGHAINPGRQDGNRVVSSLDIQDAETLARVDSGELAEVSMGYVVDYDPTPGEYKGQRYDGVQRNIRYNHIALLPPGQGRAGRDIGLRLDASSAVCDTDEEIVKTPKDPKEDKMIIRLDGKDFEYGSKEHIEYIEGKRKEAEAKAETESARADALDTKVKGLESELATANSVERLDALANERVELRTKASRILGDTYDFNGKTDRQVMVDAIRVDRKDFSDLDPKTQKPRSDEYVRASFDLIESGPRKDSISALPGVVAKVKGQDPNPGERTDANDKTPAASRARMVERNRNAWQAKK